MEIKDAKVLWNKGGPVKVMSIRQKESPEDEALLASYGACNSEWVDATDEGRMILLLNTFVSLTVRYEIPAKTVHEALLEIHQYARLTEPERFIYEG